MQKKSRYRKENLDVLTLSATHYVDKIYHTDIHKDCQTYIILLMEQGKTFMHIKQAVMRIQY